MSSFVDALNETEATTSQLPPINTCDVCNKDNSFLTCSACSCVYYCSKVCQKQHWKIHKPECVKRREYPKDIEQYNAKMDILVENYIASENDECSICLEPIGKNPFQLKKCSHIFCYQCIEHHMKAAGVLSCPLCRSVDVDKGVINYIHENCVMFITRSKNFCIGHPQRTHFANMARLEYDKLAAKEFPDYLFDSYVLVMLNADILYIEGKYDETILISKKVLEEIKAKNYLINILLLQNIAQSYIQKKEYVEALDFLLQQLGLMDDPNKHIKEMRNLWHNLSICFYYTGEFEKCTEVGAAAIEMNRHYEGVYKYIALSFKGLGDLDRAIWTMRKAVRYETPWDTENKSRVTELLNELIAEKSQQQQQQLLLLIQAPDQQQPEVSPVEVHNCDSKKEE
eukprot:gene429-767_t